MKKAILIGAALLASTAALGAAVAAGETHLFSRHEHGRHSLMARDGEGAMQLADRGERDHHGRRRAEREHHRGEREGRNRGRTPQAGPADLNAPVPDNGLFNNKARPKVEVQ